MTHTPHEIDWSEYAERLALVADVEADVTAAAARMLAADGLRVAVDVGCGAGAFAVTLAGLLGPDDRVLAVDNEPALLELARERAAAAGVGERVAIHRLDLQADLHTDGYTDDAADGQAHLGALGRLAPSPGLVWASGVVHHLPDQQAAVTALARLLAPGGTLALGEGGTGVRSLPHDVGVGRPGLEARLDAASTAWFEAMRAAIPGSRPMPYGWPAALRRAGLVDVQSRSLLLERPAPPGSQPLAYVLERLRQVQQRYVDELDPDDTATLQRLTDPADPAYLGHRDDVHVVAARTVHAGRRAG